MKPPTSFRLNRIARQQLDELAAHYRETKTTILTVAIDRMHREGIARPEPDTQFLRLAEAVYAAASPGNREPASSLELAEIAAWLTTDNDNSTTIVKVNITDLAAEWLEFKSTNIRNAPLV